MILRVCSDAMRIFQIKYGRCTEGQALWHTCLHVFSSSHLRGFGGRKSGHVNCRMYYNLIYKKDKSNTRMGPPNPKRRMGAWAWRCNNECHRNLFLFLAPSISVFLPALVHGMAHLRSKWQRPLFTAQNITAVVLRLRLDEQKVATCRKQQLFQQAVVRLN